MNWQAILLTETETKIKILIKEFIFSQISFIKLKLEIKDLIDQTISDLESIDLKRVARPTLERFSEELLRKAVIQIGVPQAFILLVLSALNNGKKFENVVKKYITIGKIPQDRLPYNIKEKYGKQYFNKVKTVLNNLVNEEAKYSNHISLRNVAEMTVRYEEATKNVNNLIQKGINLVRTTVHANCSKRCEKWQGGYYTLDNTYQIVDGHKFIPLSLATDQFYTTKQGKTYKNGHIFGFNCRHKVIPYFKGQKLPKYSAKLVEKERNIDNKMRWYERAVRHWREKAILFKNIDNKEYLKARNNAIAINKEYQRFATANKRAFFITRTQIL